MADVVLAGVSKIVEGREVLAGIDLTIPSATLAAVVGPSGAGKTSLLRAIAGLMRPDSGTIIVGGRDVTARRVPGVAMVFQGDVLYEHLDVAGNLRFPLQVQGAPPEHVEEVSESVARRLGVRRLWSRKPATLSSGQRGMAATARAISRDGLEVLLLDEPFAQADRRVRRRFRAELQRLHAEEGVTTILATNDQEEAMAVADLLVVLMDGRIVQAGAPRSLFESPDSTAVASFVGSMNLLPGVVHDHGGDAVIEVAGDRIALGHDLTAVADGTRVVVGLHAHELVVAPPGTPFGRTIHVTVGRVEDLGSVMNVLFGLGSSPAGVFVMTESHPTAVHPGDRLELTWAPDRLRLFRADTGRVIPV